MAPVADRQGIALHLAGFVDQASCSRPVDIVERGIVEKCEDAFEQVLLAHDTSLAGTSSPFGGPHSQ